MKNQIATQTGGPIILKFESEKTVGEVYEIAIDTIDRAFDVMIALGSPELLRQAELRLDDFKARVKNAQYKLSTKLAERATFEELQEKPESSNLWTIENGKRVTLNELEGH